jgi:hypothetical protein
MKINSGTQSFNMVNNNLRKDAKKGIEDKFSHSENANTLDKEFAMKPSFKENMKEIARDGLMYGSLGTLGGMAGLLMAGAGILGQTSGGIQGAAAMALFTGIATYNVMGGSGRPCLVDTELRNHNLKIGFAAAGIALGCGAISAVSTPLAVGAGFVAGAAGLYSLMDK